MSRFRWYVGGVVALGVLAVLNAWTHPHTTESPSENAATLLLLAGFVVWAELTPIPVASMWPRPRDPTTITVSTVFALSMMFIGGLSVAMTAFVFAGVIAEFRRPWWKVAFNAGHMALSLSIAAHVALLIPPSPIHDALAYPLAIIVYAIINYCVVAQAIRFQMSTSHRQLLAYYMPGQVSLVVVTVAFVPLAVALSHRWALVALLGLPLLGMRNAIAWLTQQSTRYANGQVLQEAMKRHEFVLRYQPVYSLVHDRTVSVEGLVRWIRPDRIYGPQDVVGLAESAGDVMGLTQYVITEALDWQRRWAEMDIHLKVSVNVPPRLLANDEFVTWLQSMSNPNLIIELLESEVIADFEIVSRGLARLRVVGLTIAIDDFGAGQTSIALIDGLNVDRLKIDKSLVDKQGKGLQSAMAIAWIHELATVAEGVESPEHIEHLATLGVDAVQGYAIAKPMAPDDLPEWLENQAAVGRIR